VATVVTKSITYIMNLSITSGLVLDQLISARVEPVVTKGSRPDDGYYSIMDVTFNALGRTVYKQLES